MAKIKSKGTVFQVEIASVFTAVAQVIELDKDQDSMETFDADTLDKVGAFMPKEPTGRSTAGNVTGTLFYDPALANQQFITDTITTPVKVNGKIILADVANRELTFEIAGMGMGLSVRLNNGLTSPFTMEINDPVWPT